MVGLFKSKTFCVKSKQDKKNVILLHHVCDTIFGFGNNGKWDISQLQIVISADQLKHFIGKGVEENWLSLSLVCFP